MANTNTMDVAPPNDPIVGGQPDEILNSMYPANAVAYRIPIIELVQNDRTPPITDAQKLIYERGRQLRDLEYEKAREEMERSTGTPGASGLSRSRPPRSWDSYAHPTESPEGSTEGDDGSSGHRVTATTTTTTTTGMASAIRDMGPIEDDEDEAPRGRHRVNNAPPSSLRPRSSSRLRQQRVTHSRAASPAYTAQQTRRRSSSSRSSSSSRRPLTITRRSPTRSGPPLNTVPLLGQQQQQPAPIANPLVSINRYVANLTSNQRKSCFLCNTHVYFLGQTNLYQAFREFTDRVNLRLSYEFDSTIAQYVDFYDVFRQYAHQCGVTLPYMDSAKFMDHFKVHTLTPEAIKHEIVLQYMGLHEAVINGCMEASVKRDANGQPIGIVQRVNMERGKFLIAVSNQLRAWMSFDAIKNNVRSSALLAKGDELLGTSMGIQAAGDPDANNILPLTHSNSPMSLQFFKLLAENSDKSVHK